MAAGINFKDRGLPVIQLLTSCVFRQLLHLSFCKMGGEERGKKKEEKEKEATYLEHYFELKCHHFPTTLLLVVIITFTDEYTKM